MRKLTSLYVRAWCEEWAMTAAATEQALTTYAQVESDAEVLACLAGLAAAQRSCLLRTGKLISLKAFLRDPSLLPPDPEPNGDAESDTLSNRFF